MEEALRVLGGPGEEGLKNLLADIRVSLLQVEFKLGHYVLGMLVIQELPPTLPVQEI